MRELAQSIPDVEALLALEPEELGAKLLFCVRRRRFPQDTFHPSNLNGELWEHSFVPGYQTSYPANKRAAVDLALVEA